MLNVISNKLSVIFLRNKLLKPRAFTFLNPLTSRTGDQRKCKQINGARFEFRTSNVISKWKKKFSSAQISEPKSSIENIIAHVLNTRKISDIYRNNFLTREQVKSIIKMCNLRMQQMPIQYIIEEWDFRNLTLKMRPPVFIPRPETEKLVDLILQETRNSDKKEVLELCCGSGAISLALLQEDPNLNVVAIDKSVDACNLTLDNAEKYQLCNRILVMQTDIEMLSPELLNKKFSVIVSNPPYVPSGDVMYLQPEILRYEDRDALDGGFDGLALIKLILQKSSYLLYPGGQIFLEVDPSHPQLLAAFLRENNNLGLSVRTVHKDIFQRDRFVIIGKI